MRAGPLALALLGLALSGRAAAQERDPWLGPDKALHFSLSAGLAGGGYAVGATLFEEPPPRLIVGGALALGLGVAKELYDLTGAGDPSWRDLAWDVIGTATGLAIAWAIDHFFFRRLSAKPAASTTPGAHHAARSVPGVAPQPHPEACSTFTLKVQWLRFPEPSSAVTVTGVTPSGKALPDGWL